MALLQVSVCALWTTLSQSIWCPLHTQETHKYGLEFPCTTTINICYPQTSEYQMSYFAYASTDGVDGRETAFYQNVADAQNDAVYLLFSQTYDNISCNCIKEQTIIGQCKVETQSCFSFSSAEDVAANNVQYESWITHSNYTGHYCCDYQLDSTIDKATEKLAMQYPSCFTTSPTVIPTTNPIISNDNKCEDCQPYDGHRCLSGHRLCELNKECCERCPHGSAGHDGNCDPCKDGTEPTFDRISCEETKSFWNNEWVLRIGGSAIAGIISGIIGTCIVRCAMERWCPEACKSKKRSNEQGLSVQMDALNDDSDETTDIVTKS